MDQQVVGQPIFRPDGSKAGTIKEVSGPYLKVDVSMRPDYWLHRDSLSAGHDGGLVVQDDAVHYDAPATIRDTDERGHQTGDGATRSLRDGATAHDADTPIIGEQHTLRLHEERVRNLTAVPEQVPAARITTRVVEVTETITVPLLEERVLIERVAGGGEVIVDGRALAEGETVEVVVRRERPLISKDVVDVERIDMRTEPFETVRRFSIPLRHEEFVAEVHGDIESMSDAPTST